MRARGRWRIKSGDMHREEKETEEKEQRETTGRRKTAKREQRQKQKGKRVRERGKNSSTPQNEIFHLLQLSSKGTSN